MKKLFQQYCFITILSICVSVFSPSLKAQYWETEVSSRYFAGGTGAITFGTISNIEVAPSFGFNIIPRVSIGISPLYQYFSDRYHNFSTNFYGGRVFSELVIFNDLYEILPINLFDNIFLHAEYELLSLDSRYIELFTKKATDNRYIINSAVFGIGAGVPLGEKSSLKFSLLTNYNGEIYYPYSVPMVRFDLHFYFRKAIEENKYQMY